MIRRALLLALLAVGLFACSHPAPDPLDDPAVLAVVEGTPIRRERFELRVAEQVEGDLGSQPAAVLSGLFDQMIEEEVLASWARQNMSPDEQPGRAESPAESRRRIVEAMLDKSAANRPPIDDATVEAYWKEHPEALEVPERIRVRQIIVATAADAKKVRARLRAGESFEAVSRDVSLAPNADRGGMVGTFSRGQLPQLFDDALFRLKEGAVSAPILAPSGYHVFLVEWHGKAGRLSLEEAREGIRAKLERERRETAARSEIAKVLDAASVRIAPDRFGFAYTGRWTPPPHPEEEQP